MEKGQDRIKEAAAGFPLTFDNLFPRGRRGYHAIGAATRRERKQRSSSIEIMFLLCKNILISKLCIIVRFDSYSDVDL